MRLAPLTLLTVDLDLSWGGVQTRWVKGADRESLCWPLGSVFAASLTEKKSRSRGNGKMDGWARQWSLRALPVLSLRPHNFLISVGLPGERGTPGLPGPKGDEGKLGASGPMGMRGFKGNTASQSMLAHHLSLHTGHWSVDRSQILALPLTCWVTLSKSLNLLKHLLLYFLFGHAMWHARSYFLDKGSNPCPLQWKHGVLTTKPPGNSL